MAYIGTDSQLQLDAYFEAQQMAVEYQGKGHYFDLINFGEVAQIEMKDAEKAARCGFKSISLIEVPFWWDQSISSIKETITKCCPQIDLG